jgi:sec-independent protein translocase protein TatA
MLGNIGMTEIMMIAVVLLVLFGSKQLPVVARNMGESGKELKKASRDLADSIRGDVK